MADGKPESGRPADARPESADKSSSTRAAPGQRRGKRVAPTIDLKATELPPEPTEPAVASTPDAAPEPAEPEYKSSSARDFASSDRAPRSDNGAHNAGRFKVRENFSASTLAAGLVGGLLVSLVLFVLWLTGMVPIRYAGTTAMRARVSVLEMQMHDLTNRAPGEAKSDNKTAEELTQRIARLEQQPATPAADPKIAQRLEAAEGAMKSLGLVLAALSSRIEELAAKTEANGKIAAAEGQRDAAGDRAIAERLEKLERATAVAEAEIAKASASAAAADGPARLAVGVTALRDAVTTGEPFAAQLAAVKSLGADPAALAPLEPFAASGVPRAAALATELSALVPALLKSSGVDAAASGGFFDRLQANASKLVRVRPAGDATGDSPAAIAARIEVHAAHADIDGALGELKTLPLAQRAAAEGWIKKAEARKLALEASRKLTADTFRALGKP